MNDLIDCTEEAVAYLTEFSKILQQVKEGNKWHFMLQESFDDFGNVSLPALKKSYNEYKKAYKLNTTDVRAMMEAYERVIADAFDGDLKPFEELLRKVLRGNLEVLCPFQLVFAVAPTSKTMVDLKEASDKLMDGVNTLFDMDGKSPEFREEYAEFTETTCEQFIAAFIEALRDPAACNAEVLLHYATTETVGTGEDDEIKSYATPGMHQDVEEDEEIKTDAEPEVKQEFKDDDGLEAEVKPKVKQEFKEDDRMETEAKPKVKQEFKEDDMMETDIQPKVKSEVREETFTGLEVKAEVPITGPEIKAEVREEDMNATQDVCAEEGDYVLVPTQVFMCVAGEPKAKRQRKGE